MGLSQSQRPTFSVVIPLYQKERHIEDCLQQVRAQKHAAAEVIVVDDGSTDRGGEIAKAVGKGWVKYIWQQNSGVSAARNLGILSSSCEYIAFLDADDKWEPNHLEYMARLAVEHPDAAILGTGWTEAGRPVVDPALRSDPHIVDLNFFLSRAISNFPPFWTSAVAIRRQALTGTELFPLGSRIAEDQDAWITMLQRGYGVRGLTRTADYTVDACAPTISAPRAQDFESVIFKKWSEGIAGGGAASGEFVASHRLYTIERHVGYTSTAELLRLALETKTKVQMFRKLRVVAKIILAALRR